MPKTWTFEGENGTGKRFSARYLLLRYIRAPSKFDAGEIRRLAAAQKAQCTIIRERASDTKGSNNYLAFIDFSGKRFQTRNPSLFDVQGCHPHWHLVTTSAQKTYDWCKGRGNVLFDNAMQRRARFAHQPIPKGCDWDLHVVSDNKDDFFHPCEELLAAPLKSSLTDAETGIERLPHSTSSPMTKKDDHLEIWRSAFKVGFEAGTRLGADVLERKVEQMLK